MPIDLTYAPDVVDLVTRTERFIADVVLPVEDRFAGDITAAGGDDIRRELNTAAKAAGVFAPHAPIEYGGAGLSMSDRAPVFAAAGYSTFGPIALHIGAPDEGNVHMLAHIATDAQRDEFLAPLATGDVRSAFAMTEPSPGAGADPNALNTMAVRVDGGWKINGRKRFITGADGAAFFIIMARTKGEPGDRGGATMFLAPADTPGISIDRHIHTVDKAMIGGHCEMTFADVFVPDGNVLGEVNEGYRYAQVRLGPARMTHVMRWLGSARRCHDVALSYVAERDGFGGKLGDLGMIQQMLADNEIDLAASNALLVQACHALDRGEHASNETSIAKTYAAEAYSRIADRSMQMCGGLGVSDDLPIARLAQELRPFRIYDGPSEVHRWAIAKRAVGRTRKASRAASGSSGVGARA
ncbi:putative acyl-CoA dehydrogenase [Gordonia effusa NBRC 100432]|uniref:Putative acyl-CoA dehydrogenase n=1 Tax=Gordonia effusa NBRC 100432 TaxID=1077974 RepID=H0R177_9ACTN|nr:acyl-CoA dehydrogenase family protein [Gordonia effusa]GAB18828.1 putative acyl-CoA dehydrogenase [Gordonia effusa NBRC 100432]